MNIKQTLKDYLIREFRSGRSGQLADDENLLLSGLLDSIGVMRFVAFIEDSLDVTVPPEDVTIENFSTVNDIEKYLKAVQERRSDFRAGA